MLIQQGKTRIESITSKGAMCAACQTQRSATFYRIRLGIYGHVLCPTCKNNLAATMRRESELYEGF